MGLIKPLTVLPDDPFIRELLYNEVTHIQVCFTTKSSCYMCGKTVELFFGEPKKFVYFEDTFDDVEYVKCPDCHHCTLYVLHELRCDE